LHSHLRIELFQRVMATPWQKGFVRTWSRTKPAAVAPVGRLFGAISHRKGAYHGFRFSETGEMILPVMTKVILFVLNEIIAYVKVIYCAAWCVVKCHQYPIRYPDADRTDIPCGWPGRPGHDGAGAHRAIGQGKAGAGQRGSHPGSGARGDRQNWPAGG
jgi:hypothetical protein